MQGSFKRALLTLACGAAFAASGAAIAPSAALAHECGFTYVGPGASDGRHFWLIRNCHDWPVARRIVYVNGFGQLITGACFTIQQHTILNGHAVNRGLYIEPC